MKFTGCICNSNMHDISQSEKWAIQLQESIMRRKVSYYLVSFVILL
jgi:hypothetical protein